MHSLRALDAIVGLAAKTFCRTLEQSLREDPR
jgi:hypothetical protein